MPQVRRADGDARPGTRGCVETRSVLGLPGLRPPFLVHVSGAPGPDARRKGRRAGSRRIANTGVIRGVLTMFCVADCRRSIDPDIDPEDDEDDDEDDEEDDDEDDEDDENGEKWYVRSAVRPCTPCLPGA